MLDKTLVKLNHKVDRFVPDGKNVHMPRHEFLQLLFFNSPDGEVRCHICDKKAYLVVDHCHTYPNLIRGLLCDRCNIDLGRFEAGHYVGELTMKIVAYLENPPAIQLGIIRHYKEYYQGQNERAS